MSKAFTRESDDTSSEETPVVRRPQLPPGTKNYITREGADRLRERMEALLASKTRGSKAEGPANAEQRKLEVAIHNIQQTLAEVVVAEAPADREKVGFGATVRIRRGDGEEERYRIVGVEEANPESGAINWLSPLARVLLSRRAGDRVRFRAVAGEEELTILSVEYLS